VTDLAGEAGPISDWRNSVKLNTAKRFSHPDNDKQTKSTCPVKRPDITFVSGRETCAGWLYRSEDDTAKAPCVVMANGISLTRHDGLTAYAEALGEASAAVLIYDHRDLGDSGGQPRQRISPDTKRLPRVCRPHTAESPCSSALSIEWTCAGHHGGRLPTARIAGSNEADSADTSVARKRDC
jgi:hypothetical protein